MWCANGPKDIVAKSAFICIQHLVWNVRNSKSYVSIFIIFPLETSQRDEFVEYFLYPMSNMRKLPIIILLAYSLVLPDGKWVFR